MTTLVRIVGMVVVAGGLTIATILAYKALRATMLYLSNRQRDLERIINERNEKWDE